MYMVRACLEMMPRLSAEESLTEALRIAVGTGSLSKEALTETRDQWSRAATDEPSKPATPRVKTDPARARRAFERMNRKHTKALEATGG